jgi:hypothetical protein
VKQNTRNELLVSQMLLPHMHLHTVPRVMHNTASSTPVSASEPERKNLSPDMVPTTAHTDRKEAELRSPMWFVLSEGL